MRRKGKSGSGGSRRDRLYGKRFKYNVPDKHDEALRQEDLAKLGKRLDEKGKPTPITEKQLTAICVNAVRQKWMSCNSKLHFLNTTQEWDMREETRTTKLWACNQCKGKFKATEINVDHIAPAGEATTFESFKVWASNVLDAGGEDDLQILCIPCHEIKNVMDARGITDWEVGKGLKVLIKYLAMKVPDQKAILAEHGFKGDSVSNKEKREKIFTQLIDTGSIGSN